MLASVNTSMLASVHRLASWSAVVALLAVLPAASGAQEEKARQEGQVTALTAPRCRESLAGAAGS